LSSPGSHPATPRTFHAGIRVAPVSALRASLQNDYDQATVPLTEAAAAAHAFVVTNSEERLNVTRARAEALLQKLADRK
jgi:hypothetical protein